MSKCARAPSQRGEKRFGRVGERVGWGLQQQTSEFVCGNEWSLLTDLTDELTG
jgi:hypothetical protein